MGNMDYPDILHLSSGFVQSMIHSSNITNNVAVFFPFNLTGEWWGRGAGSDVCFCQSISWPADIWQGLCPSISWLHFWQCVHPPHDLHIWQCLCWSISWQYCYLLLLTVFVQPSHDLQTHLTSVFIHLITCRHFCVFIHLMTCRHF